MQASSRVRLESKSDYINPSEACIIQLEPAKTVEKENTHGEALKVHQTSSRSPPHSSGQTIPKQTKGTESPGTKVQIALADCLACSGCVTSAEEVLIEQHGTANLMRTIDEIMEETKSLNGKKKTLIASIAPQVIADMCVYYADQDPLQTFHRIFSFLTKRIGFHFILSTGVTEELSAYASAAEYFIRRIQHDKQTEQPLPLLASACPGFVCYIEKQHPSLLPHLSRVMSQQSILGLFLVSLFACSSKDSECEDFFHLSIQPCFDRKLEASRKENEKGTHFVLSALELKEWMESSGFVHGRDSLAQHDRVENLYTNIEAIRRALKSTPDVPAWIRLKLDIAHPVEWMASPLFRQSASEAIECVQASASKATANILPKKGESFISNSNSSQEPQPMDGSGAFHKSVLLVKWLIERFSSSPSAVDCCSDTAVPSIRYRVRRNSNHQEAFLSTADNDDMTIEAITEGKSTNRFVTIMYGFQHIQNLTRGLRKEKGSFIANYSDYVEVMACPGGCLNGSAQSRKTLQLADSRDYLRRVEARLAEWKDTCDVSSTVDQRCSIPTLRVSISEVLHSLQGSTEADAADAHGLLRVYRPLFSRWVPIAAHETSTSERKAFLTTSEVQW